MCNIVGSPCGSPFLHPTMKKPPEIIVTDVPQYEADALIAFYNSGNGDNWNDNTGWLTDPVVGNWAGITVENGHVTRLKMVGDGNITADIKHLKPLSNLLRIEFAASRNIVGNISVFENMNNITNIEIDNTQIYGSLVSLSNKPNIRHLKLDNLNITGDISVFVICVYMQTFRLTNTLVTGDVNILSFFPLLYGTGQYSGFHLDGSSVSSYTSTTLPTFNNVGIYIYDLGLSQTEIDNFLVDMDNSGSTNCPINVSGNSVPSQTGLNAITSLEGKGCTITYDTP